MRRVRKQDGSWQASSFLRLVASARRCEEPKEATSPTRDRPTSTTVDGVAIMVSP